MHNADLSAGCEWLTSDVFITKCKKKIFSNSPLHFIYAFVRHFHPKTLYSRIQGTHFISSFMHSLGIKPMILTLQALFLLCELQYRNKHLYQICFKYFKYTKNSVGFTLFDRKQLLVTFTNN